MVGHLIKGVCNFYLRLTFVCGMRNMHKRIIPIVHIIGLPGAGKTTLAKRLGRTLKVSVFCIGYYRTRFPQTAIGEADAWVEELHTRDHGVKFPGGLSENSIAF